FAVSLSLALLIALSTFSLGILAAFAFCITALSLALVSGLGPPSLTAITISFPILVNVFAIADQRFIFLAFLNSNALPISFQFLFRDGKIKENETKIIYQKFIF